MRASSGLRTARSSGLTAFALPWCPTLSTSISPTSPERTTSSRTRVSASPVSSAENSPQVASITTLDSFSLPSSIGSRGHTTVNSKPPTLNLVPAVTSLICAPIRSRTSRASASSSAAPAETIAVSTDTTPSSPSIPSTWSACRCVPTNTSTRRSPCRAAAARIPDVLGPASTSAVRPSADTKTASPCPTSSTVILGSPDCSLKPPLAMTISPHIATAATRLATRLLGCGHAIQTAAPASVNAHPAGSADHPSGMAAYGSDASHPASAVAMLPAVPANMSKKCPAADHTGATRIPASPTTSRSDTRGETARFAIGETSDTLANVATVSGRVAACATSVSAIGPPSLRSRGPTAMTAHASPSLA